MKIGKNTFLFLVTILCIGVLLLTACSCSGRKSEKTADTRIETEKATETEIKTTKESETVTTKEEVTNPGLPAEEMGPVNDPEISAGEPATGETNGEPEEDSEIEYYELPEISLDD